MIPDSSGVLSVGTPESTGSFLTCSGSSYSFRFSNRLLQVFPNFFCALGSFLFEFDSSQIPVRFFCSLGSFPSTIVSHGSPFSTSGSTGNDLFDIRLPEPFLIHCDLPGSSLVDIRLPEIFPIPTYLNNVIVLLEPINCIAYNIRNSGCIHEEVQVQSV